MIHPGLVLQRKLDDNLMSRKELAIRTGVTEKHICTIVNCDRNISPSFAKKLGYVFENIDFWLNLQTKFDSEQLKIQEENSITREEIKLLSPLREIMQYLIERNYIHNGCGEALKILQLRSFLGVSDLRQIPYITYNATYRAQLAENIKINPYVLFAWQRLCERETETIYIKDELNIDLLKNNIIKIKALMNKEINEIIVLLQEIFAFCGISFRVVKNFRGAPVQGFIKQKSDNRLILCLTTRGKRADTFWFTLFHEIAHIINGDYGTRFVDFDSVYNGSENQADIFAQNTLINPEEYRNFIQTSTLTSWNDIVNFAHSVDVPPFIVLGRLQKDNFVDWTDYNNKVIKYEYA